MDPMNTKTQSEPKDSLRACSVQWILKELESGPIQLGTAIIAEPGGFGRCLTADRAVLYVDAC